MHVHSVIVIGCGGCQPSSAAPDTHDVSVRETSSSLRLLQSMCLQLLLFYISTTQKYTTSPQYIQGPSTPSLLFMVVSCHPFTSCPCQRPARSSTMVSSHPSSSPPCQHPTRKGTAPQAGDHHVLPSAMVSCRPHPSPLFQYPARTGTAPQRGDHCVQPSAVVSTRPLSSPPNPPALSPP